MARGLRTGPDLLNLVCSFIKIKQSAQDTTSLLVNNKYYFNIPDLVMQDCALLILKVCSNMCLFFLHSLIQAWEIFPIKL